MMDFLTEVFWESDEAVVMDPGLPAEEIAALRSWVAEDENCEGCLLFSSSGSSGRRKWIVLSKEALLISAQEVVGRFGIGKNDVLGLALPIYHVGGFGLVARAWVSGAGLVKFAGKWSARNFVDWVVENGVTISSLVPTQVSDLVAGDFRAPDSLRAVVVGGGRFDESLQTRGRDLGWPMLASYGMTETGSQVATERVGEKGMAFFDRWEARVGDDGNLWLRGGALLAGYVRPSREGFVFDDPKVDGWFETSDLGILKGGCVEITGRADRRVKVLGELVDLEVIEGFFRQELGCQARVRVEKDERAGVRLFLKVEDCGVGQLERAVGSFHGECRGFERLAGWEVGKLKRSGLGKVVD